MPSDCRKDLRRKAVTRMGVVLVVAMTVGILAAPDVWTQSKTGGSQAGGDAKIKKPLVTFVELGSVKCVPCRQMQPVMKAIETKYGNQVSVVFYDVWEPDQREYAETYDIRVIPTQVFLDSTGKEFFRHEGFLPEVEIDKLLQKRGLKVLTGT
jgi:thioredoxin 1